LLFFSFFFFFLFRTVKANAKFESVIQSLLFHLNNWIVLLFIFFKKHQWSLNTRQKQQNLIKMKLKMKGFFIVQQKKRTLKI